MRKEKAFTEEVFDHSAQDDFSENQKIPVSKSMSQKSH